MAGSNLDLAIKIGEAVFAADQSWGRRYGMFYYEEREKPHVVRKFGPQGGTIFESSDRVAAEAFYEQLQRADAGLAALSVLPPQDKDKIEADFLARLIEAAEKDVEYHEINDDTPDKVVWQAASTRLHWLRHEAMEAVSK